LKVLEIIERDQLVAHAARMGEHLARGLRTFSGHPLVGEVRTQGLGGALDFLQRDRDDRPINDTASAEATCLEVYAVLLAAGVVGRAAGRSLIFAPPLIIQASEIDEICTRLGRSLDIVLARRR
jgi:adenosylmethionine-8-amino-7-oxononanoate aminotransferase